MSENNDDVKPGDDGWSPPMSLDEAATKIAQHGFRRVRDWALELAKLIDEGIAVYDTDADADVSKEWQKAVYTVTAKIAEDHARSPAPEGVVPSPITVELALRQILEQFPHDQRMNLRLSHYNGTAFMGRVAVSEGRVICVSPQFVHGDLAILLSEVSLHVGQVQKQFAAMKARAAAQDAEKEKS